MAGGMAQWSLLYYFHSRRNDMPQGNFKYCIEIYGVDLSDNPLRDFNDLSEAKERATELWSERATDWCVMKDQGDGTFDCCCREWDELCPGVSKHIHGRNHG